MFDLEDMEKDANAFALDCIRTLVHTLPPQERVDFFYAIEDGYCRHCGDFEPKNADSFTQIVYDVRWDYEEDAPAPHYHIYCDGPILGDSSIYIEAMRSKALDTIVKSLCDLLRGAVRIAKQK